VRCLLDVVPAGLHDRVPVFLGSAEDVAEPRRTAMCSKGRRCTLPTTPVGLASLQRLLGRKEVEADYEPA